jgi:signal transduction histidine kinase
MLGLSYSVLPIHPQAPLVWTYTPANLAYVLTFANMLLFCVAQLRDIRKIEWAVLALSIVGMGFWYDHLRSHGSFNDRTLLLTVPLTLIWVGQWTVLNRVIRQSTSSRLRALRIITIINLSLQLIRLALFQFGMLPMNFTVEQMPGLLVLLLCFQFGLHLLELSAVSGYWLEQVISRRQVVLLENQRVNQLLAEKDNLIHSLSRVYKVAETGALSASLAHEINQPLSAVQLDAQMLEVLLKERRGAEETAPFLQRIIDNNARVAQTISNLRNLFRSSQASPVLALVDPVIEQAIDLASPQLKKNNIQIVLQLAAPAPIYLASGDLQMVLINLLNNACEALQHTPNACIDIHSWQTDVQTCIQVSDNGPGIADADQLQIFNLLKTNKAQGTGIGLWLSRHIIERQGGSLTLESSPQGAKFLVTFPKR